MAGEVVNGLTFVVPFKDIDTPCEPRTFDRAEHYIVFAWIGRSFQRYYAAATLEDAQQMARKVDHRLRSVASGRDPKPVPRNDAGGVVSLHGGRPDRAGDSA